MMIRLKCHFALSRGRQPEFEAERLKGDNRAFEDASISSTKFMGAYGSTLTLCGALRSAAGIRGRCSECEPQYVDRREVMRVPVSAEFRDRVHVNPQIGWGADRILAMQPLLPE